MKSSDIIEEIKKRGYKVTPQRRAIIDALLLHGKPQTAKEILERVRVIFPEVSLDTVYRNLNLLTNIGLLIKINLKNSETSRFEILEDHHHHLICLGCGEAICLERCPLDDENIYLARERGYTIVSHAFEIYGYCPTCRKTG